MSEEERRQTNVKIAKLLGFTSYPIVNQHDDLIDAGWDYPKEFRRLCVQRPEREVPDFLGMIDKYIEITSNTIRADFSLGTRRTAFIDQEKGSKVKA